VISYIILLYTHTLHRRCTGRPEIIFRRLCNFLVDVYVYTCVQYTHVYNILTVAVKKKSRAPRRTAHAEARGGEEEEEEVEDAAAV